MEYPKKLWKSHNEYPLAPEKVKVENVEKLICSFKPKNHYVLHYRNLKQYLEEGMILKKVHRGIKFYQSKWMEPYIRKNTDLRKVATSSFEKDFFKLMNNSEDSIMFFLSQNPCTPLYKTPVISLSFSVHSNIPCLFSVIFCDKQRVLKK